MSKRVLNVGQCGLDQSGMSRFLRQHFDVSVENVDLQQEALDSLRDETFDLVLVNRLLDMDGSDGMAIVKAMKADGELADVPVMLVSNYADAQERAIAAGAEMGFGKAEYGDDAVVARLAKFLD